MKSIGRILCFITILTLGVTAALKLADLRAFDQALSTWSLLPGAAQRGLILAIPGVELLIALFYLAGIAQRQAVLAAMIFLTTSAVVYAAHLIAGQRPNCGCAGVLQEFAWARAEGWWLLARNAGLLLLCLPQYLASRNVQDSPREHDPRRRPRGATGFTLIETLVVITVIAVILTLAMPMLRGLRRSGRETRTLSYLTSHAANISVYAAEYKDLVPYYGNPYSLVTAPIPGCSHLSVTYNYFYGAYWWHVTMPDLYRDAGQTLGPSGSSMEFCNSWFLLSATLRSRAEFCDAETRTGPNQWRPVRLDEVTHPARKVMFRTDLPASETRQEEFFALCDGHAAKINRKHVERGYPSGEGGWSGSWFNSQQLGMHTLGGFRGMDLVESR